MKSIYQYKDFEGLQSLKAVKDVDTSGRTITGYAAAFNNVDLGKDLIEPGAFAKTIAERGPQGKNRIMFLNQHDTWQILGKPQVLKEDSYGLYHESKIANTTLGNDVLKLFQEGVMDSFSIGYRTITENMVNEVNHLKELYLYEHSGVTFPMNEGAIMTGIKGLLPDMLQEKIKKAEKFCRDTTASDDTIEMLLLQIKQMQQIIIDLKNTTEPDNTTPPGNEKNEADILISEINNMNLASEIYSFTKTI